MRSPALVLAVISVLALIVSSFAVAQTPLSTLKRIKENRTIVIGHRESSMPFSYLDERKQPVGYSVDLCIRVVEALQAKLGLPELKVQYKLVTSQDRIALVKDGSVDLECGSTTNNLERQREVSFSVTTFVAANRLVAKKKSNIRTLVSLKNKTVVSTGGTTSLKQLKEFNSTYNYGMTILEGKDHADSFNIVEEDRAVAFSMDDILLASLIASAKNPGDFSLTTQSLSIEPYGLMMRRGDPAFKRAVDDVIIELFRSGDIKKIYSKWFESPIPPKGINLKVPMSSILEKVIKRPIDSGNPMSYN